MSEVVFSEGVEQDLKKIRAYDRNLILDAIESRLAHSPNVETRNRKRLECLVQSFAAVPPIWELRAGEYRIFYDVEEEEQKVYVRAIRKKPGHKTMEEIL
jgi:mRNA-degrading endonuclease RelE of RelBE toxin-antitoxin system